MSATTMIPTSGLRWLRRQVRYTSGTTSIETVLQQRFVSSGGKECWVDVSVVDTTDQEPQMPEQSAFSNMTPIGQEASKMGPAVQMPNPAFALVALDKEIAMLRGAAATGTAMSQSQMAAMAERIETEVLVLARSIGAARRALGVD